jgi:hypothetical protein
LCYSIGMWKWMLGTAVICVAAAIVITWQAKICEAARQECQSTKTAHPLPNPMLIVSSSKDGDADKEQSQDQAGGACTYADGFLCSLLTPANLPTIYLVLVGAGGIVIAVGSLGIIQHQTRTMERQTRSIHHQAIQVRKQTRLLRKSANAAHRAAEVANKNVEIFISKERVRVMVSARHLDLEPTISGFCTVHYEVIFSGPSDAFIINSGVWADAVDSVDAQKFRLWLKIAELPPIAPINRNVIHCQTVIDLDADAIREINGGTKFVRVYGFIRYKDVFDIVRLTTFRYLWQPPSLYGVPGITSGGWVENGPPSDNAETQPN